LGSSLTQGIDFQISHNLRTDTAGLFRFSLSGSYIFKYDVAFVSGGPERDQLNLLNNPLRLKARGGVTWRYEPFTTQVSLRYVNEYDNPSVTPTQRVDSWMPVDLVLRFDGDTVDWLGSFGTGLTVSLEGRNIFDEDPPYVNFAPNFSGGGGWDPSAADPVGRLLSVSVSKKF
jgi:iron complex outermembrane receptor protein